MGETAIRERPILFSGPMVTAVLSGAKTQTRRIVKPQPPSKEWFLKESGSCQDCGFHEFKPNRYHLCGAVGVARDKMGDEWPKDHEWSCPYGNVGDRLWVRESLHAVTDTTIHADEKMPIAAYSADGAHIWTKDKYRVPWKWQRGNLPSIHMPRELCRIVLEITDIRVQRLQEISEEDAIAEGVNPDEDLTVGTLGMFEVLWESINGPGSWESNPWVWAITFNQSEVPHAK